MHAKGPVECARLGGIFALHDVRLGGLFSGNQKKRCEEPAGDKTRCRCHQSRVVVRCVLRVTPLCVGPVTPNPSDAPPLGRVLSAANLPSRVRTPANKALFSARRAKKRTSVGPPGSRQYTPGRQETAAASPIERGGWYIGLHGLFV